jgi:hypothetical protein
VKAFHVELVGCPEEATLVEFELSALKFFIGLCRQRRDIEATGNLTIRLPVSGDGFLREPFLRMNGR